MVLPSRNDIRYLEPACAARPVEPLRLTVTDAAQGLGVSRKTLSPILNGRARITPEMAIRLSRAFDTSPESWLNQQLQYDLWQAQRSGAPTARMTMSSRPHR